MPLDHAKQIVGRLGPVTVALDRDADPVLARDLALAGCRTVPVAAAEAGHVGLARWRGQGDAALAALLARVDALALESGGGERPAIDRHLFAAGWSRHPAGVGGEGWGAATAATLPPLAFYRRGAGDPDDLLRRGDPVADALLAQCAQAADRVRAGDTVLVVGEHTGAAVAVLRAVSRAGKVTTLGTPAMLADAPAHAAGLILLLAASSDAMDDAILAAARHALRPDGRLLIAWPVGEAGIDALRDRMDEQFVSESWVVQRPDPAGGPGFALPNWPATETGDRVLLVASANPLVDAAAAPHFVHPAFAAAGKGAGALVDFASAYDNPWLYRVMVQLGERMGDEIKLARLAECVLDEAAAGSADRGAAITVLGYRVLDGCLTDAVPAMLGLADAFLAETERAGAPHLLRWRLSLMFLAGRLSELAEAPDAALGWFRRAAAADWQGFSPLLATKSIAARYHAARLLIAAGEHDAALAEFGHGLQTALAAAAAPHERLIGDPDRPLPFYMAELAEVIDMGAQCANALAAEPLLRRDPGLFWRQIDVKRFGLFAWADAMARENRRLRGG